jgi:hypothetical protein
VKNVFHSQQHRLAFWQVPRCAGTSMSLWLGEAGFDKVDDSTAFDDDTEHFALCRDPYDRYLSCLSLAFSHCDDRSWPAFLSDVEQYNMDRPTVWDWDGDLHFLPQSRFLEKMPGGSLFDVNELGFVSNWLRRKGVDLARLPHVHRGDVGCYRTARNRVSRGPVRQHYRSDVWASSHSAV